MPQEEEEVCLPFSLVFLFCCFARVFGKIRGSLILTCAGWGFSLSSGTKRVFAGDVGLDWDLTTETNPPSLSDLRDLSISC